MSMPAGPRPVVLIAAAKERSIAGLLADNPYAVVEVYTGTLALAWAPDLRADAIILDADLPDMSGIDVCRLLHNDVRIGHTVPIVVFAPDQPSAEQRVAALRAGAWDFLRHPRGPEDLSLALQTYVQAKRNIDVALADGLVDPATGLHGRPTLARRARELGALMSRQHGALACVVFVLESDRTDAAVGRIMARTARVSDVVGVLGPTQFAVLAPTTDHTGAVRLAQRVAGVLRGAVGETDALGAAVPVRVGYDAVANLTYSPIDPAELLARAAAAVRTGTPETDHPWVRRFTAGPTAAARATPPGLEFDKRRITP